MAGGGRGRLPLEEDDDGAGHELGRPVDLQVPERITTVLPESLSKSWEARRHDSLGAAELRRRPDT